MIIQSQEIKKSLETDEGQAQIARALEIAKVQRETRASIASTIEAVDRSANVSSIPSPKQDLEWRTRTQAGQTLKEHLAKWTRIKQAWNAGWGEDDFAKPKALAALELLDGAIEKLSGRTGDRAESTRALLTAQRKAIADALAAFEALGPSLEGPLAVELISRISASRVATSAAYAAKEHATREAVEAVMLEIERCNADSRQIDRDVKVAIAAVQVPAFPDAKAFRDARFATEDLEKLPAKKPTARQMAAAIEHGQRGGAQAALWVCYETNPKHELLELRWKAHVE